MPRILGSNSSAILSTTRRSEQSSYLCPDLIVLEVLHSYCLCRARRTAGAAALTHCIVDVGLPLALAQVFQGDGLVGAQASADAAARAERVADLGRNGLQCDLTLVDR